MRVLVATLFLATCAMALQFTQQPTSQVAREGESAIFEASASPVTATMEFTWYANGQEAGTGSSLTLDSLQLSQDGWEVLCIARDPALGIEVASQTALLRVLPPTSQWMQLDGTLQGSDSARDFSVDMEVRLFDQMAGGEPVYTESFRAEGRGPVSVQGNRFHVVLGQAGNGRLLSQVVQSHADLYAEFHVGNSEVLEALSPRLAVTAHPYALARSGGVLRGDSLPEVEAPTGTLYENSANGKLYIRSSAGWNLLTP